MATVDVAYYWGNYDTIATPNLFYSSPQLVAEVGTGGSPSPLGAVTMLDAEAGWCHWVCNGLPYACGTNNNNCLSQTSTAHYLVTNPQPMCGPSDGTAFNWAGLLGSASIIGLEGGDHNLWVVFSDGRVYSWGNGSNGCLGHNDNTGATVSTPTQVYAVGSPTGASKLALSAAFGALGVSGGAGHFIGIAPGGGVVCCGQDTYGACGDGQTLTGANIQNNIPVPSVGGAQGGLYLADIVAVSAGQGWCMVLDSSGNVYTFGYNAWGQLGNGTAGGTSGTVVNSSSVPVAVAWPTSGATPVFPITQICAGGGGLNNGHSLAIDSAGQVWIWGNNQWGQCGQGNFSSPITTPALFPTPALSSGVFVQAHAGTEHTLLLDNDNGLFAVGDNTFGDLGNPNITTPIPGMPGQIGTATAICLNKGSGAVLPTDAVINKIWAGNRCNTIDVSVDQEFLPTVSTPRPPGAT